LSGLAVVVPSKTRSNFIACATAIRRNEPDVRIILVDDGTGLKESDLDDFMPCLQVAGDKPFVFARNCNLGIAAAGAEDVVIMNDDALLETPCGLTALREAAEAHPEVGIIAATTNLVGNINQRPRGIGLREDPRMVCFVCVLIPRRTIEAVGFLDEEFVGYGFEDDSYCLRIRRAGLKIGIHDGCFVDHASLHSTFRGDPRTPADLEIGRQIFIKKWGAHPL
jgi:GT2 family glycosyltransferase